MEWVLIFGIPIVCYGIIPGIGAFMVRSKWRSFRSQVVQSTFLPIVTYEKLMDLSSSHGEFTQEFRFFGSLEGVQEDNTIWIRSNNFVLSANMAGQELFLLPSRGMGEDEEGQQNKREEVHPPLTADEVPTVIPWSRVSSLSEGTKVYIAGPLKKVDGKFMFHAEPSNPLLIVFYDGEDRDLLRRVIWNSRQRNEYWNQFTPVALGLGVLGEIILTYYLLNKGQLRIPSILSIAGALVPILPFLPPGFLFYLLYRWLWGKARFLRAERDLLRLPLRYFEGPDFAKETTLPDGERYFCLVLPEVPWDRVKGQVRLRRAMLRIESPERYYWFGVKRTDEPYPTESGDPMVENLIIKGHPEAIAGRCERVAYYLEFLSSLCFGMGVGVNLFLALRILAWIIR